MKLTEQDIRRLEAFLTRIQAETYPEPPSEVHGKVLDSLFSGLVPQFELKPGARVLDVGCGQGVALERFAALGWQPVGITVNATDLAACRARGFDVREMDQSFLDFEDATFDLVWCRHCLEHSVMPYFTLSQLVRVLKPGGVLYVEVPAPDTAAAHQTNQNHYSTLPRSAWIQLIARSGIPSVTFYDIAIDLTVGPDMYWAFWGRGS
jgi:SAM-dependent methyltransferase